MATGNERGHFADTCTLSMLCEGIDWRQPVRTSQPRMTV